MREKPKRGTRERERERERASRLDVHEKMKMEERGSDQRRRQPLLLYDPVEDGWTSPMPTAGREWARTDDMADVLRTQRTQRTD